MKKLIVKKALSLLAAVSMLMSICAVSQLTAFAEAKTGSCGENITWTLTNDGSLILIGNGITKDLSSSSAQPWGKERTSITNVQINEGITYIGENMFNGCTSLISLSLPHSLTNIGDNAFQNCSALSSIVLPDGIVSIGKKAFSDCSGLPSIELPNSIMNIGEGAFYNCENLVKVVLPENIATIQKNTFHSCRNLSKVTIPKSVLTIGSGAFYNNRNLKTVYYTGSESEWAEIIIDQNNDDLTKNPIQYNYGNQSAGSAFGATSQTITDIASNNEFVLYIGQKTAIVFGEKKTNDVEPIVRNDRTMLPARFVAENLGATVEWNQDDQQVIIVKDDTKIVLTIGSSSASINGKQITLDSPAFVENDRTYTPVRFIAENLGAEVTWNGENQSVTIAKK